MFIKLSGLGIPTDLNGNAMLIFASLATAPIVSLGGLRIDANGFVLIPG